MESSRQCITLEVAGIFTILFLEETALFAKTSKTPTAKNDDLYLF